MQGTVLPLAVKKTSSTVSKTALDCASRSSSLLDLTNWAGER